MNNALQEVTFNGHPVKLQTWKGKNFTIHCFEFQGSLWLVLDDVLKSLELSSSDTKNLASEKLSTLSDGTAVVTESGFYELVILVSKSPNTKAVLIGFFARQVFGTSFLGDEE